MCNDEGINVQKFISNPFPFEQIQLISAERKVECFFKSTIYDEWGRRVANQLLHNKQFIHTFTFFQVYWKVMVLSIKRFVS